MTLEYLLKLSAGPFTSPLKNARNELGQFTAQTKQMGSAGTQSVNQLGGAFGGLAMKIAAAFTAWKAGEAVFSGFKKSIGLAADAESTQIAFKNLIGDADVAKRAMKGLFDFAANTPFEMPEVQASAGKLLAAGVAAENLQSSLKVLGNVTSAYQANLSTISTIFSQVLNKGQLYAEEIQQMGENGVPALKLLSASMGKTTSEVMALAAAGKLLPKDLIDAFNKAGGAGGQFANAMAEQAAATNGLLSTLHDNVNALFREFGAPLNDAIKPILTDAIGLCDQLKPVVKEVGVHMGEALTAVRDFVAEAKSGGGLASAMGQKLKEAFASAADVAAVPFRAIGAALPALGESFMTFMKPVGEWLMAKLDSAALNFSSVIMKGIRDALKAMSESSFMASMIPGLKDAAESLNGPAAMAQNDALNADSRADRAAESMPGAARSAGDKAEQAMAAAREKLKAEMDRIGNGISNADGEGRSVGQVPGFESKGMTTGEGNDGITVGGLSDSSAKGDAEAKKAATKDDKQAKARDYAAKETQLMKAKLAGDTARVVAMERILKIMHEADSLMEKGGITEEKALAQAREKVGLQEKLKAMADGTKMVPKEVKDAAKTKGEEGPHKIHGYSQKQGGTWMGGGMASRKGKGPTMPGLNLSAPGTAKASQARREAAATAAQGGEHPLAGLLKDVAVKLGKLAVA